MVGRAECTHKQLGRWTSSRSIPSTNTRTHVWGEEDIKKHYKDTHFIPMWKRKKSIHCSPKSHGVQWVGRWSLTTARFKSNSVVPIHFTQKKVLPSLWRVCVRVYLPSFNPFFWEKYFSGGKRYILFERSSVIPCIMQIYFTGLEEWHSKSRQTLTCMKMNMMSTKYLSTFELVSLFQKSFWVNFIWITYMPCFVKGKVLELYSALYADSPLKLGINMYIYLH